MVAVEIGCVRENALDGLTVSVGQLVVGESPRLSGLDQQYAELLAATAGSFPPLLVQRGTMRVIDGMHRLAAARLRGDERIDVKFVDGTEFECFLESVRANVRHGKPLTLFERRQAAVRLLSQFADWSDRSLGAACGLSPGTISMLRSRATADSGRSRTGRDGRVRPVDASAARAAAAELLSQRPEVSMRQIAQTVGASVATVRDVRARLQRGESPVVARKSEPEEKARTFAADQYSAVQTDQAFAHSDTSRGFAKWFDQHFVDNDEWRPLVADIPLSRLYGVIAEARRRSRVWDELAESLEQRARQINRRRA